MSGKNLFLTCLIAVFICITLPALKVEAASPVTTDNFRIIGGNRDVTAEDLKKVSVAAEAAYAEVTETLGLSGYKSGKIEVHVYPGKIRASARRWGSVIKVGADSFKEDVDRHVFQHELTHYLIDSAINNAPTWFHEGLAMYVQYGPAFEIDFKEANKLFTDEFSFQVLETNFRRPDREIYSYDISHEIISYLIDKKGLDKIKGLFDASGHFKKRFEKVYERSLDDFEAHINYLIENQKEKN